MPQHSFVKFVRGVYAVYLSNPKVASTSIGHCLLRVAESQFEEKGIGVHSIQGKALTNHTSVENPYPPFPVFTFVREPIDRFTSYYQDKFFSARKNGFELTHLPVLGFDPFMSIDEVVTHMMTIPADKMEHHAQPQSQLIVKESKIIPDFIGKFEQLAQDWCTVHTLSLCDLSLTQKSNYTDKVNGNVINLSALSLSMLSEYYAADYKLFEYEIKTRPMHYHKVPQHKHSVKNLDLIKLRQNIRASNKKWRNIAEGLEDPNIKQKYRASACLKENSFWKNDNSMMNEISK
jgi:hypothetical protein